MLKELGVDENMSNMTSASSEISASSGTRNDTGSLYAQQSSTSTIQEPQPKKKRNLPGHPGHKSDNTVSFLIDIWSLFFWVHLFSLLKLLGENYNFYLVPIQILRLK